MAKHAGALSLTWANKHLRLLSHEDGTYEWVEPSDFRVSEVRLLHNVKSVGEVHPDRLRAKDNLLIRGESLHALTSLLRVPEFAAEYEGKVKLVDIDPPFNTGQAFTHYDDGLEHSVWLTMLRDRLVQIKRLLSDDGSVWVHLDDYEQHRARVVLDEVFGEQNFVATIIWQKMTSRDNRTSISQSHDYIHVYAKAGASWKSTRNLLPRTDESSARYANPDDDARGAWTSGDFSAKAGPGRRAAKFYTIVLPSGRAVDPPSGRCWLFTEDRYRELSADNRVWFGETGDNVPRVKRFLSEVQDGLVPLTIWPAVDVGNNDSANIREPKSPTSRRFSHRAITNADYRAYAGACCDASDQENCSSGEAPAVSSILARRTIQRSNCLRSVGDPIVAAPDVFRQRAITSTESGPSAIAPHGYREQGEQFRVRAVRIPPAAPSGTRGLPLFPNNLATPGPADYSRLFSRRLD